MLPSKSELSFAKKGKFDLYTITNLSFMDLALAMKIKPNLYAVTKADLANRLERCEALSTLDIYTTGDVSIITEESKQSEVEDPKVPEISYDATFELKHDKDMIYEVSAKLKDVVGIVDDCVVFEQETFDVIMTTPEMKDQFVVEKAVLLNLTDYPDCKKVSILRISKGDRKILVISNTLGYQSHVPF